MQIRVGYEFVYECAHPTPMILTLDVHPSRAADIVREPTLKTDPVVPQTTYSDTFGNVCRRVVAPAGGIRVYADGVVNDTGQPDVVVPDAPQHPVETLP